MNPQIAGLAADGSALLVLARPPVPTGATTGVTTWLLPLPAGEARRLGDTDVSDAVLLPDGRILYATGSAAYVTEKDGSNPRDLGEVLKRFSSANLSPAAWPSFSSDGKRFVVSAYDNSNHARVIVEAASDGTGLHRVLQGGRSLPENICCPRWTADGKYLLFRGQSEGRWDIWALSDQKLILGSPAPVRLTNGPVSYSSFAASRDGKQIFAIGTQRRGELVHFDPRAREFVPYLGGISAFDPTFSRDGKWVTYFSYPEHSLWRCRADGSDRLQLTYSPLIVTYPRISPDGSNVAFSTPERNAYVLSMNGGTPKKVADNAIAPDWSPDGTLLAVTSWEGSDESRIVDLRSGKVSVVPDSLGVIGPWFATQDTLIAAANGSSKFVLFDFKTRKWTDLIASPDRFVNWEGSPDGKYFLYSTGGNNPTIFRMRLADHAVEEIASRKNLSVVDDPYMGTQVSVGADNSAVVTRDIGTEEVYAISVKWP